MAFHGTQIRCKTLPVACEASRPALQTPSAKPLLAHHTSASLALFSLLWICGALFLLPQDWTHAFPPLCPVNFHPPFWSQLSSASYSHPLLSFRSFKNRLINVHEYTFLCALSSLSLPCKFCEAGTISHCHHQLAYCLMPSRFSTNLCWTNVFIYSFNFPMSDFIYSKSFHKPQSKRPLSTKHHTGGLY